MNYYPHHIGDYLTATAHLTWLEDAAYRRLLDIYYSREQAIPADLTRACRLVRAVSKDERQAVETVLSEFFTLSEEGWTHARCETEIKKANTLAEKARANGKKGGRPRKEEPSANPEKTQPVIPGLAEGNPGESERKAPNPNPNYSVPNGTGGSPPVAPAAVDVIFGMGIPLLTAAGVAEKQARTMLGMFRKQHGDDATVRAIQQCADDQAIEPVGYLQRVLRSQPKGAARAPSRSQASAQWSDELRAELLGSGRGYEIDMGVIDASS